MSGAIQGQPAAHEPQRGEAPLDRCPYEHCGRDLLPGEICPFHGHVGIETPFGDAGRDVWSPEKEAAERLGLFDELDRRGEAAEAYRRERPNEPYRDFEARYLVGLGPYWRVADGRTIDAPVPTVPNAEGEPVPIPLTRSPFASTYEFELRAWTWRDEVRHWWRDVRETVALWLAPWLRKVGTYEVVDYGVEPPSDYEEDEPVG